MPFRINRPWPGLEEKWGARWEDAGTFRFDRTATRDQVYSIDTPPLTVSGSLHIGHVFSFTHTDTMARYKRMRGLQVFYPMGWDDNGLATERRVQNYYGVRCDPSLPYQPRIHAAGHRRAGQGPGGGRGVAPELRGAVRSAGRRGREGVRGGLAAVGAVG